MKIKVYFACCLALSYVTGSTTTLRRAFDADPISLDPRMNNFLLKAHAILTLSV